MFSKVRRHSVSSCSLWLKRRRNHRGHWGHRSSDGPGNYRTSAQRMTLAKRVSLVLVTKNTQSASHQNPNSAQTSEPIPVARIKSQLAGKCIRSLQCGSHLARHLRHDPAIGIDGSRHPRIGVAQQPAIILHCPHAGLLQMLRLGAAVAIPAVVRDVHENLRSIGHELANLIRENRLVANENSDLFPASAGPATCRA